MADTLEQSVANAVKDNPPPVEEAVDTGGNKVEAKEEKPEEVEEKEDHTLGLDEVEQRQAVQLFAALKDPNKAPTVLKFLAEQAGYIRTEKKAAEVKDDILSVLNEELGPEFEIISKRLGPALDKIINKKLSEGQADIRTKLAEREEAQLATEADSVTKSIAQKYFDADELPANILSAMSKQMDKMNPSPDQSVEDYIHDVFAVVAFKEGISTKTVNKSERVARNRTDAPSRLASDRAVSPKPGETVQTTKMSLRDAVEAAAAQVSKELK